MAEIDELFVRSQVRRCGIGTALLDVAEVSLTDAGCTCVQLQLGTDNRGAQEFYNRRHYAARAGYRLFCKPLAAAAVG